MLYIRSNLFVPARESRDEPLHIHTRLSEGVNPTLIMFVHGWGGSRYKTWGNFPRFLFEEFPDADIALFDYVSGLRRVRRGSSVKLAVTARELADLIRETDHEKIVLIGHSMGGVVTMAAIKELIDSHARDGRHGRLAVERIRGLFLLATPQAGSAFGRLLTLSTDGKVLRPGSAFVNDVQHRFADRVQAFGDFRDHDRFFLPTRALIASRDRIVTAASARLNLPSSCTYVDRASHTSSVKPISPDSGGYRWITSQIRQVLEDDQTATRAFSLAEVKSYRAAMDESSDSVDPSGNTEAFRAFRYTHEVPSQRSTPYPVLYVPFGEDKGKSFPLDKSQAKIGRGPDCEVSLDDISISREHAMIVKVRSRYIVRDLGSRNGTYVDHERIERDTDLVPGSILHVGAYRFVFLGASL